MTRDSELALWRQFELEHVRYGEAQGVRSVGTTGLTGQDRKDWRVSLGTDRNGEQMMYVPDVMYCPAWDPTKRVILEDKWQTKGGSCEAKPFEVLDLLRWALHEDPSVVGAYLVLGGAGWSKKALDRLWRKVSEGAGGVQVFFTEAEFLAHGIPELHLSPAQMTYPIAV